jgi:Flp pilus assembly protein CpaB
MRVVQIGILGVGLALAGFGVYMAQEYVNQTEAAIAAVQANRSNQVNIETTEVLVATRPLRYGEPVRSGDVRAVLWPADSLPPGAPARGAARDGTERTASGRQGQPAGPTRRHRRNAVSGHACLHHQG